MVVLPVSAQPSHGRRDARLSRPRAQSRDDPAACCSKRQVFTCVAATPSAWAPVLSVSPGSSSRATAAALNSAVYRLRVFFVMTFFQMVSEFNMWSGLAGQGQPAPLPAPNHAGAGLRLDYFDVQPLYWSTLSRVTSSVGIRVTFSAGALP